MTDLIRWEETHDGAGVVLNGYAGEAGTCLFQMHGPWSGTDVWTLQSWLPGQRGHHRGAADGELKPVAEELLREFASSVGAVFPESAAISATARDRVASDLAHPVSRLAGLTCGMRNYLGADGDEWLNWIRCLDEAANEAGMVFEALLDGDGEYERVLPQMVTVMRGEKIAGPLGRWQALKDWLAGQAKPPEYVAESADIAGHGYRLALAKMAELEEGK